ncbi:MAG: leucine-rich repeat protein [Rikenellaceae bacterium]
MKRYYTILALVALVISMTVACKDNDLTNELNDPTEQDDNSIAFSSSVQTTKAVETDINALQEYGKFNVSSFLEDDDFTYYFTTDVLYDEDSGWGYSDTRYWPSMPLSFYAYSPVQDNIVVSGSEDYTGYALTYTCPSDIDEQVDILVKTLTNQTKPESSAVGLEFQHALSSLKFKIQFEDEKNVTLNSITLNYVNIEKKRTYNFKNQAWDEPTTKVCFNTEDDLLSTAITLTSDDDNNKTTIDPDTSPILFDKIDNQLMIVPQPISSSEDAPQYISIQISYNIVSVQDSHEYEVKTGVMPLPAPVVNSVTQNEYKMGEVYTYTLAVNGDKILFGDVSIERQDDPVEAYGNIDLGLITTATDPTTIEGYTIPEDGSDKAQYYYTTALRVQTLLESGVRDFVVVGSLGANTTNTLGDGKIGYYGSESSPFSIGADLAGLGYGEGDLFSIDLRGTYDYPEFQYANNDTSGEDEVSVASNNSINPEDPILIAGMFSDVDRLDEIILPYGIMAIGNHAFEGCDALKRINIAEVQHIEIGAFQDASALEVVESGALTRVHEHGFNKCVKLTTIDLSGVTEIDAFGFVNCESLTDVDLSSLVDIGAHAFNGCVKLTLQEGTSIPEFTIVEDYAFAHCIELGSNNIALDLKATTKVGHHAFSNCEHIQLTNGALSVLDTVGAYAFADCILLGMGGQEFYLPEIDVIDTSAFADCGYINIVEGLKNLTQISYQTFMGCTSLTGYRAGSSTPILELPEVTIVKGYGFNETAVTNISFSEKLTTIEEHAFNSCTSLTTLSGLENVAEIGRYALADCSSLEELSLPSLTDGNWSVNFFTGCTGLKTLSLPLLTENTISYTNDENVTRLETLFGILSSSFSALEVVNLENLVFDIPGWGVFKNHTNLREVNFASATSVGRGAFYGCTALESIDVSSAELIGAQAFDDCTTLEELVLPKVTAFELYFISGCTSLKKLEMNALVNGSYTYETTDDDNVVTSNTAQIGSLVRGCTSLEEVILPNITGFDGVWWGCFNSSNLKYLDLSSVKTVINGLFDKNTTIISVNFQSATEIEMYAFSGATSLLKLNLSGLPTDATIGADPFAGILDDQCEIWLSDEQAATASGNTWQGVTWKAIHTPTSGDEFTLY